MNLPANVLKSLTSFPQIPVSLKVWGSISKQMDANLQDLGDVLQMDPGLVARVLAVANSAYCGGGTECTDIHEALFRIGLTQLLRILGIVSLKEVCAQDLTFYRLTHLDSLAYAGITSLLMEKLGPEIGMKAPEAATIGMLHGVGRGIIQHTLEQQSLAPAPYEGDLLQSYMWEEDKLTINHAEVGMLYLRRYRFPESMLSVISHYVRPHNHPTNRDALLLYASAAHAQSFIRPAGECQALVDEEYAALGIGREAFEGLRGLCEQYKAKVALL